jgi:arginine N-succinyltransferase
MFLMRNVVLADLEDLYELSGKVLFINLPHDKEIIKSKIKKSLKSFSTPSDNLAENYYIFVLEDTTQNKVIGVSMIHAQHGTEEEPHFFLRVSYENKFSSTINTGFVHGTLKLGLDTNGPTEIGGLVLHPEYRGNKDKLGKQISFVRFLYMGLNPSRFKEDILSELMPPFDKNGKAPLWEAIGRRFMNMEYREADILSRSNKEFILSLFPSDNIYMSLLPMDARDAIGNVGADTLPVQKMLEKIGFRYANEVDPFDGGPHYKCKLSSIKPIQALQKVRFKKALAIDSIEKELSDILISFSHPRYEFLALKTKGIVSEENIFLYQEIIEEYDLLEGTEISAIVF